jgi:hypothetical protein
MPLNGTLASPEIEFAFKPSIKILIFSLCEEKRGEMKVRSCVAKHLSPVPNAVWLYCCHVTSRHTITAHVSLTRYIPVTLLI